MSEKTRWARMKYGTAVHRWMPVSSERVKSLCGLKKPVSLLLPDHPFFRKCRNCQRAMKR